jgi:hypothetical protein
MVIKEQRKPVLSLPYKYVQYPLALYILRGSSERNYFLVFEPLRRFYCYGFWYVSFILFIVKIMIVKILEVINIVYIIFIKRNK